MKYITEFVRFVQFVKFRQIVQIHQNLFDIFLIPSDILSPIWHLWYCVKKGQQSSLKRVSHDSLRGLIFQKTRHIRVKSSIKFQHSINRVKILLMSGYQSPRGIFLTKQGASNRKWHLKISSWSSSQAVKLPRLRTLRTSLLDHDDHFLARQICRSTQLHVEQ